jgi:signal transduction histidine kinase
MAIVVFFVERRQTDLFRTQMRENGAALVQAVADLSVTPLMFYDVLALRQNMQRAAEDPDVLYAIIFNRDAKAFAANEEARRNFTPELLEIGPEMGRLTRGQVLMGEVQFSTEERDIPVLEIVAPVLVGEDERLWGAVKLGLSLEPLNAEIRKTRIGLISLGFLGLALGALGSVLLAERISRPLETLVEGTIKVAEGDLNHRIHIPPGDEIGELAANFNQMTAEILEDRRQIEETSRKLIDAEKLATIGRLATAMAHEIRNPLTAIKLNIQKVGKSPSLSQLEADQMSIAESGIRQVERIVKDILSYARSPKLTKDWFSARQLVEDALTFAEEHIEDKRIEVAREYDDLPPIQVDGDRLRQVLLNIVLNSAEAVTTGGKIVARTRLDENDGRKIAVLEIADDGCGIEEKNIDSVFEPFFTTKSMGTGLGLTNARKVIELHDGTIHVSSQPSEGTTITIELAYDPTESEESEVSEVNREAT